MTESMLEAELSLLSCSAFTERLASKAPTPGGGGAAAMTGSLAAALAAMATNLTIGKKKFLPFEDDHRRIIAEADALRVRFLALMDADAAAFEPLSRAYSMDKAAPGYADTFRAATLQACRAPFEMMESCTRLIRLLEELLDKCSVLLLSDVGCAALAAGCGLEAASMNVLVNTRMLPDDGEALALAAQASSMLQEYLPRARAVSDTVMAHLKSAGTRTCLRKHGGK